MIRILTQRRFPTRSWQSWVFHPDPDVLFVETEGSRGAARAAPDSESFTRTVSSIRVGHVYKLTRSERLVETTRMLARHLGKRGRKEIRLLDVGGSDGVTTLDAVRDLADALGIPVFASIMDRYARLERRKRGWLREYCAPDGSPVLLRLGALGLQLSSISTTRDPLSRCLGNAYMRYRSEHGLPAPEATISLIHPTVRADARIDVVEWNVLDPNSELRARFDAVRASNILNEGYFSREQIETALAHIHTYLLDDGLLLVSRNHLEGGSEVERGSLWQKTATGFRRIDDLGAGSDVASVVDAFDATRSRR